MIINYPDKKSYAEITSDIDNFSLVASSPDDNEANNMLVFGDNYHALKALSNTHRGKIDLVYIDPPFATNNNFTIGETRVSTISSSKQDKVAYSDVLTEEKYLEFLRERLLLLRDLLSENGSIYLHIDYKIGHYVKVIMDEIFGINNFKNDITRIKCNPKNFHRKAYGNIKDMILFYSKTENHIWNKVEEQISQDDLKKLYKKVDKNGNYYTTIPLHAPGESNGDTGQVWRGMQPPIGRHWRTSPTTLEQWDKDGLIEWSKTGNPRKIVYLNPEKGKKIQDIWEFKDTQRPCYPTEKNLSMLEQIILNSSNFNSIVLDCFCGSGTTLVAAELHGRKWIGIDQSLEAIKVTKTKLQNVNAAYSESEVLYCQKLRETPKKSIRNKLGQGLLNGFAASA